MLGFSGVHRTGKSTLTLDIASKHGLIALETNVRNVFILMGMDSKKKYEWDERMRVQQQILLYLNGLYDLYWNTYGLNRVVCDRTPLDLLMYTYSEVNSNTLSFLQSEELRLYTEDCISSVNKYFRMIVVIQPGISVNEVESKASVEKGYMEHLNLIILGLTHRSDINVDIFCLSKKITNRIDRIDFVSTLIEMLTEKNTVLQYVNDVTM